MALYLTEDDVLEVLTMDTALEAVEEGFVHLAKGAAFNFPRHRLPNGGGTFNFMAATAPELGVMGLKIYGVGSGRTRFFVYLHAVDTSEILAVIEASGMGQIRTGAASGIAAKYMAREDAGTVGMIGSGYQASTQLEAVCKVRNITGVKIYSRTRENRERLASVMERRLCIDALRAMADVLLPLLHPLWIDESIHAAAAAALFTAGRRKLSLVDCTSWKP